MKVHRKTHTNEIQMKYDHSNKIAGSNETASKCEINSS